MALDRRMVKTWLNYLEPIEARSIKVGDFGGGEGYFAKILTEKNQRVFSTVIDFDQKEVVQRNKQVSYLSCDLNQDFPTERFDIIVAWNLLEHLVNPEEFLKKCKLGLNSRGLLVIQTPSHRNVFALLFRKIYWGGLHAPRHFVIYSPKFLNRSLKQKGFEIISRKHVQDAHFVTVTICRLLHLDKKVSADNSILSLKFYRYLLPFAGLISTLWSYFFPSGQVQFIVRNSN
jgi:2-polyprenyl-3-methyl-5-hydroxy-6-metoxy-1,4-benzoquinol methylase